MDQEMENQIDRAAKRTAPQLAAITGDSIEECEESLKKMLREVEEENRKIEENLQQQKNLWLNRNNN
jgi:hypothetical protein